MKNFNQSVDDFLSAVKPKLVKEAESKGYSNSAKEGGRELYDAVALITSSDDAHALGEIVYKAKRFKAKRNTDDLLKIAAWAFLLYDKENRRK